MTAALAPMAQLPSGLGLVAYLDDPKDFDWFTQDRFLLGLMFVESVRVSCRCLRGDPGPVVAGWEAGR